MGGQDTCICSNLLLLKYDAFAAFDSQVVTVHMAQDQHFHQRAGCEKGGRWVGYVTGAFVDGPSVIV